MKIFMKMKEYITINNSKMMYMHIIMIHNKIKIIMTIINKMINII